MSLPRRWAVINEAVVLEFWEVHELEFYWDSTLKSTKLMMDISRYLIIVLGLRTIKIMEIGKRWWIFVKPANSGSSAILLHALHVQASPASFPRSREVSAHCPFLKAFPLPHLWSALSRATQRKWPGMPICWPNGHPIAVRFWEGALLEANGSATWWERGWLKWLILKLKHQFCSLGVGNPQRKV